MKTASFLFCFALNIALGMQNSIACADEAGATVTRPNVLFIFADDWGRHAGIYRQLDGPGTINDVVRTPNIDALAKQGVVFRSAFVSSPSCTPCRSALFSGQHFWRCGRGSILRGAKWEDSQVSFAQLLHDSGYQLGLSYKAWGPGVPNNAPMNAAEFKLNAGGAFNQFSQTTTERVKKGQNAEAVKQQLVAEATGNFAKLLKQRDPAKPFFYWFGPTNTHRSWTRGSGKSLCGIDPDDLAGKLPPFLADVPEVREDIADYFGEVMALDLAVGALVEQLRTAQLWDDTIIVLSGDHGAPGFPHGKCNLYDFGSSVPLIIAGNGISGINDGVKSDARIIDHLVSLTDLAPTLLEAASLPVPESMTGHSLLPWLRSGASGLMDSGHNEVFIGRERHVDTAREDRLPYPQRAIRTQDYLYIINFKPDRWPLGNPYHLDGEVDLNQVESNTRYTLADEDAGPAKAWLVSQRQSPEWRAMFERSYGKRPYAELYDLRKDPYQMNNLAVAEAYQSIRQSLHQRLMDELTSTGDPRVVDEGRFFETAPMTDAE